MIQEFSVSNFLSIKEKQTISFLASHKNNKADCYHTVDIKGTKLLKIAAIYGANEAGKTALMIAVQYFIDFMLYPCYKLKFFRVKNMFECFDFKSIENNIPTTFNIIFFLSDKKYNYTIFLMDRKVIYESLYHYPKGKRELIFNRNRDDIRLGSILPKNLLQIANNCKDNISFFSFVSHFNDFFYSSIYLTFKNMTKTLYDDVIYKKRELITKMIECMGLSMNYDINSSTIKYLEQISGKIINSSQEDCFLLQDNIEHNLHPFISNFLIETFLENTRENNVHSQLLFTTHNTNLLESDLLRDDEVWFAEETEEGSSEFNRITDFTGVRKGVSRKTMYETGKFGALPITTKFIF